MAVSDPVHILTVPLLGLCIAAMALILFRFVYKLRSAAGNILPFYKITTVTSIATYIASSAIDFLELVYYFSSDARIDLIQTETYFFLIPLANFLFGVSALTLYALVFGRLYYTFKYTAIATQYQMSNLTVYLMIFLIVFNACNIQFNTFLFFILFKANPEEFYVLYQSSWFVLDFSDLVLTISMLLIFVHKLQQIVLLGTSINYREYSTQNSYYYGGGSATASSGNLHKGGALQVSDDFHDDDHAEEDNDGNDRPGSNSTATANLAPTPTPTHMDSHFSSSASGTNSSSSASTSAANVMLHRKETELNRIDAKLRQLSKESKKSKRHVLSAVLSTERDVDAAKMAAIKLNEMQTKLITIITRHTILSSIAIISNQFFYASVILGAYLRTAEQRSLYYLAYSNSVKALVGVVNAIALYLNFRFNFETYNYFCQRVHMYCYHCFEKQTKHGIIQMSKEMEMASVMALQKSLSAEVDDAHANAHAQSPSPSTATL